MNMLTTNRRIRTQSLTICIGALLLPIAFTASAIAQQTSSSSRPPSSDDALGTSKWEIGGGGLVNNPTRGTAHLPDPGVEFTTAFGASSRRISSWYFGDGALLLNQVFSDPGFAITQRITPLDPMLTSAVAERTNAGTLGFRISRVINPRLSVGFSVDHRLGQLKMTSASLARVEASRASFNQMWTAITTVREEFTFTAQGVTSIASIRAGNSRDLLTTGVLDIHLKTNGRVIPYLTAGAGVSSNLGEAPSVTLAGNYHWIYFPAPGPIPIDESDTVTIRIARAHHVLVGVVGGGARCYLSPRWGLRLDVRDHLAKNTTYTSVDASPTVALFVPAHSLTTVPGAPAIQWSNNPSKGFSTLSGPSITGFRTFTGSGLQSQVDATAGVFWRF